MKKVRFIESGIVYEIPANSSLIKDYNQMEDELQIWGGYLDMSDYSDQWIEAEEKELWISIWDLPYAGEENEKMKC